MLTFEQARALILGQVSPLEPEQVSLPDAVGRIIAEDLTADWDLPSCDNSAMDGYAVRTGDCRTGTGLQVCGYLPAGSEGSFTVEPGTTIKVMTGSRIPAGADAVIPYEELIEQPGQVVLQQPVVRGQHIRFKGEDIRAGELVIRSGTLLRPPEIGLLAAFSRTGVAVVRQPKVAILATGDELVDLGQLPGPGQVVNSNLYALAAALREIGAEPVLLAIARDNRESHLHGMTQGLEADALITTAGVSAGDHDLVRDILTELGVQLLFWRVAIKPGGPTAFGVRGRTPVFSLPGNPVSSMVTFEAFVRPALLRMMGHTRVLRRTVPAVLQEAIRKKPDKVNFLRVRLVEEAGRYLAFLSGNQQTSYLKTMVQADGIVVLPKERTEFSVGEELQVQLLRPELELQPAFITPFPQQEMP